MMPSDEVRFLIAEFGSRHGVDGERLRHLWKALRASSVLAREINDAVARGCLRGIGLADETQPDGWYSEADRTMHLPLEALSAPPSGAFGQARITYLVGRLVQHSQRVDLGIRSRRLLEEGADRIARSSSDEHDYTEVVADRVAFLRHSEARADIAGWNALASAIRKKATLEYAAAPGLHDMFGALPNEMVRYVDVNRRWTWPIHKLKPDLHVDDKLFMHGSADNVEAMARHGFDRSLMSHDHGSSNRAGRQVADVIGAVGRIELARRSSRDNELLHDARIDMATLGLNPRVVEQHGIELADAGCQVSLPYLDKSAVAPTVDVLRNSCAAYSYDPVRPRSPTDLPSHPDHRLYQQALKAVYQLNAKLGRRPDSGSEKLAASLAASARQDGLKAIHRVVPSADGKRLTAVQHRWLPWLRKTSQVDVEQALRESGRVDRGRCEVEGATVLGPLLERKKSPALPAGRVALAAGRWFPWRGNAARADVERMERHCVEPDHRPRGMRGSTQPSQPCGPKASRTSCTDLMGMQRAAHPDHPLYRQALQAVYRLDAELGRRPDEHSEQLAASLVASARKDGLKAIHRVVLSDDHGQAFGVQDGAFPCWRKTTQVWVEQATHTLVTSSTQQCDELRYRTAQPQTVLSAHQRQQQKMPAVAR